MPANNSPFPTYFDKANAGNDKVAAVLEFNCGVNELDRIQNFLDNLAERGIIKPTKAECYCSQNTSPTLYFP